MNLPVIVDDLLRLRDAFFATGLAFSYATTYSLSVMIFSARGSLCDVCCVFACTSRVSTLLGCFLGVFFGDVITEGVHSVRGAVGIPPSPAATHSKRPPLRGVSVAKSKFHLCRHCPSRISCCFFRNTLVSSWSTAPNRDRLAAMAGKIFLRISKVSIFVFDRWCVCGGDSKSVCVAFKILSSYLYPRFESIDTN